MTLYRADHVFYGVYALGQDAPGGEVEAVPHAFYGPVDPSNSDHEAALRNSAAQLKAALLRSGKQAAVYSVQWSSIPVSYRVTEHWTTLHRTATTGFHRRNPTPFVRN